MDHGRQIGRLPSRSLRSGSVALLMLFVVSAPSFAACSAAHDASSESAAAAMPTTPAKHDPTSAPAAATTANRLAIADQPLPNADAMWASRPAYVRADPETEAAYHYAILHPELVKWMPCYCGCSEMGHGSNLDCYLRPDEATFDEHASYCDICVQITLKTRDLVNQGTSLNEIRSIVDQTWGGSIPGTPTALPPV